MDRRETVFKTLEEVRGWITILGTFATIMISVFALIGTLNSYKRTQQQSNITNRLNHYTAAQTNYNAIVQSLNSSDPAVQIISIRRLTQFVQRRATMIPRRATNMMRSAI